MKINNHYVSRTKKLITSGVEIGQAREYGAVKEAIDNEKIKQLVLKGVKITGIKWIEYVNIRKMEEK